MGLQQLFGYKYRPDTPGYLKDTEGLCLLASKNGALKPRTHKNAQEGHM